MIVSVEDIAQKTTDCFSEKYPHFKEFLVDRQYNAYWTLCRQAMHNRDLMGHIIFCNDLFGIPPVKTFLCNYAKELKAITGRDDAKLPDYVKKSIGAIWGFVFKYILEYEGQKSVSVSLNKTFMVKTATCYTQPQKKIILAF